MTNSTLTAPDIKPSVIRQEKEAWILEVPRLGDEGKHFHTYGLLTPYFKGLTEGRLLATQCINPRCPISKGDGDLWLPPRADCPDCHQPMVWQQIAQPRGYIYTFTYVERGGTGLELACPYYQIDVKIEGVCTIVKSYLNGPGPIRIGDRVKACFRKDGRATNTSLDLYFELE